ncbi:hypothetical protein EC9_15150 [Rosistilla ulvae]|uniref:Uncharacterized protein n=1 Tax=Rosistilla ulvae TaxID=1930277 RepID=A0A517LXJ3_9BACT|nr:hypothetical protein EC9_15150 [Rosistilla ulvae]
MWEVEGTPSPHGTSPPGLEQFFRLASYVPPPFPRDAMFVALEWPTRHAVRTAKRACLRGNFRAIPALSRYYDGQSSSLRSLPSEYCDIAT